MTKFEMNKLLETVLHLAKHGLDAAKRDQKEVANKYLHGDVSGYYPFTCGWLEKDLEDIIKVLEDKGVSINETC